MYIDSIELTINQGTKRVWKLEDCTIGKINLIVGKNATGKTRTLNVISNLANLVAGDKKLPSDSAEYKVIFKKDKNVIQYEICYKSGIIYREKLIRENEVCLDRGKGGIGKIRAERLKDFLEFQAPENELACVARRDNIQHPFFEDLNQWGKSVKHYYFGSSLGKDFFELIIKRNEEKKINLKDTNMVVGILNNGLKKYDEELRKKILKDMGEIGYKLENIYVAHIQDLSMDGLVDQDGKNTLSGIWVKEKELKGDINQNEMSQGMFRTLSLIVQLNLSMLESKKNSFLIDDIGEGLDFERSVSLIKYLIKKSKKSAIQIIMTTNDRFVMNNVPLEYWCVMQRIKGRCKVFNYRNSKKLFDEFEYTGLNNFDFLSTEFYRKGFEDNEKVSNLR